MTAQHLRTQRLLPESSVWSRGMIWWHTGFYVALVTVAAVVLLTASAEALKPAMTAALAGLGCVYPFLTRREDLDSWKPRLYVVLLIAVVGFLAFTSGGGSVILFIAFPQVWMFSGSARNGVAATAAICVVVAAGQLWVHGSGPESLLSVALQAMVSFLASTMLGMWIYKIIEQSELRGELLAELEAAKTALASSHQQQGAMAERERMAREIHDTLAQGFTSIVMLTEAAQAQLRGNPQAAPESADDGALARTLLAIRDTARENLQEARALIASSGPAPLAGSDLLGALRRLGTAGLNGTRLTAALPAALPELSPVQQVVIFRTAQEALSNIRRHAAAGNARLQAAAEHGAFVLTVTDDGVGFDSAGAGTSGRGFGLASMAARLAEIGGSLSIRSAPGEGTRLTMTVPLGGTPVTDLPEENP